MSLSEMRKYANRSGFYPIGNGEMRVAVTVTDVRSRFGQMDLFIQPVSGEGGRWVTPSSVELS